MPNLWCVASVDGVGKARGLERGRAELEAKLKEEGASASGGEGKGGLGEGPEGMERLRVCVQVNTSGESSKSGCEPDAAAALVRQIRDECPHLHVQGLMTIGAIARSEAAGKGEENEDFKVLKQVRERVVKELGMEVGELELSMGMSGDFEDAVSQGSSEVRVGSGIFGDRERRADAVVKGEAQEQK